MPVTIARARVRNLSHLADAFAEAKGDSGLRLSGAHLKEKSEGQGACCGNPWSRRAHQQEGVNTVLQCLREQLKDVRIGSEEERKSIKHRLTRVVYESHAPASTTVAQMRDLYSMTGKLGDLRKLGLPVASTVELVVAGYTLDKRTLAVDDKTLALAATRMRSRERFTQPIQLVATVLEGEKRLWMLADLRAADLGQPEFERLREEASIDILSGEDTDLLRNLRSSKPTEQVYRERYGEGPTRIHLPVERGRNRTAEANGPAARTAADEAATF